MNILVTGGAGFIGSNFIYYMIDKYPNYSITCIDKLTYAGNIMTLFPLFSNDRFKFIKCDITDNQSIDSVFSEIKPDIVVNFAAESHVDRSIKEPLLFLQTNIIGTQILLDACKRHNVTRYHQVSTDEVYGDLPLNRPDLKFTEKTPICTSSPYSASKASADLLCLAYYRTYKMPITISRCSNNYGPYQFPEKLIPLMTINALSNKKLPIYGTGKNVRDWLYVDDHCSAIDLIIHKGTCGQIYNIGGHNEYTNLEIVLKILDTLNKSDDLIEFVEDRKGHDLRYAIDSSYITDTLGWKPMTKFNDGISKTINWYIENKHWRQSILSGEYQKKYEEIL